MWARVLPLLLRCIIRCMAAYSRKFSEAARRRCLFADSQQHAQAMCVVGEVSNAPAVPAADGLSQQASCRSWSPGEMKAQKQL